MAGDADRLVAGVAEILAINGNCLALQLVCLSGEVSVPGDHQKLRAEIETGTSAAWHRVEDIKSILSD